MESAGAIDCNPPDLPSGTSGAHTKILGANYATCGTHVYGGDPTKVEYLGAAGAAYGLSVETSQYVDIQCIALNGQGTTHYGIYSGSAETNANITLNNVTIQGFQNSGIHGSIGGLWTTTDLLVYMNGFTGWDFDPGSGNRLSSGSVVASYNAFRWNGCEEEWPLVHAIPVANNGCVTQAFGGNGDAIGTPVTPLTFSCDRCDFGYNMQDAFDGTHIIGGTQSVTNSNFYANLGGNIKMGPGATVIVANNTALSNCWRPLEPVTGAQTGFNTSIGDPCRAGAGNGANPLSNAQYVGNAYAVGTAVTGTDTHFLTQLSIGNVIAPADFNFGGYGGRTVTAIADDTHLTVSSSYPTNWGSSGAPLHLLYVPGGTPSSTSNITWYHNTLVGYESTMIGGQCLVGIQAGGGYAEPTADMSFCPGYTFTYKDNLSLGLVDTNCTLGTCGGGTDPPGQWDQTVPTVQDYNAYYNMRTSPCSGVHDTCVTNPLFVSQPALTVPLNGEAILDNYNFNLSSGSGLVAAGVTIAGQTNDQAGVAWASPPSIGALQFTAATASTPTFSPVAGTYTSTQSVTISSTTSGATLCYTSDGTTPTANGAGTCTHGTTYSTAVSVASSLTLKAVASKSGFLDSSVTSAAYTITSQAATPTFSPVAGTYTSVQSVTISTTSSGAILCYTTNGATPATNGATGCTTGTLYSGAVAVATSQTVKAVAGGTGYTDSSVGSAAYVINIPQVATPTASPLGGTYTSAQTVTLSDSTSGATICYTINGSTPTTASAGTCGASPTLTYSTALTISSTTTVKAIGTKAANTDSGVMSQTYIINIPVSPSATFTGLDTFTGTLTVQ
jgi:hypothetical protein